MSDIPVDVIRGLLIRLPVISLLRFRSVSKQWCALIDSQDFSNLRWALTASHPQKNLILESMGTINYLNLDCPNDGVRILDTPFKGFTRLWGSCNGFILLQSDDSICLLNPSTKRFVNLPYCSVEYPEHNIDYHESENYGFGYDVIRDDYKVIKLVELRDEEGECVCTQTKIYSLKSGSWRRIHDLPYCVPEKRPLWGAFVGGSLHANLLENVEFVLGFDLSIENYKNIPLPEAFDKEMGSMHVTVLGDCLCLLGEYINNRTDVWVMNKYGVKESWTKLFSIAPPTVKPYLSVIPLIFSEEGTEVLMNYDNKRLIWYDMKSETVRDAPIRNLPHNFYAYVLLESLVSLQGFDVINTQKGPPKAKGNKDNTKSGGFLSMVFSLKLWLGAGRITSMHSP